jgi:hypothetical protein
MTMAASRAGEKRSVDMQIDRRNRKQTENPDPILTYEENAQKGQQDFPENFPETVSADPTTPDVLSEGYQRTTTSKTDISESIKCE